MDSELELIEIQVVVSSVCYERCVGRVSIEVKNIYSVIRSRWMKCFGDDDVEKG